MLVDATPVTAITSYENDEVESLVGPSGDEKIFRDLRFNNLYTVRGWVDGKQQIDLIDRSRKQYEKQR